MPTMALALQVPNPDGNRSISAQCGRTERRLIVPDSAFAELASLIEVKIGNARLAIVYGKIIRRPSISAQCGNKNADTNLKSSLPSLMSTDEQKAVGCLAGVSFIQLSPH